ncbi:MAG TPA: hypothetical protein VL051_01970 [Burkholderiaceae bacterium]|nr:hypothetical protein [Burkholderiaceae bacterium]HUG59267.1 hypothetical protein [Candidimonas sp.]
MYSSYWNVTVPTEAKRRWLGVRVLSDSLQLPPQTIAHFAANWPYFLPEIVHQSGWRWKGVFLF